MNYNKLSVLLEGYFPYRYHKNLLRLVVFQFLIVFLFLYLFRPFDPNPEEHNFSYAVICLLQAFAPALIVYLYFLVLNRLKKWPSSIKWTLKLQLLHSVIVLFFIGLASFGLRLLIYNTPDNLSWYHFWSELRNVYLAGSLFVAYFLIDHYRSSKNQPITSQTGLVISIKTETKKDDFDLSIDHFVFAKSEGNYIDLYCFKDDILKKELKRISLKNFEAQLPRLPQLIRCHRTYLVHTKHVAKINGNAQGYLLTLHRTEEKVPVSRPHLSLFEPLLAELKKA